MNFDNRRRALAEVASIEAWHKGFTASRKAADLHVDVSFDVGRIGGEGGSDIRFRLALKRAEVVVIIPAAEPASFQPGSVSRDAPTVKVSTTETFTSKAKREFDVTALLRADPQSIKGHAGAEASYRRAANREAVTKIVGSAKAMKVSHKRDADGSHKWHIEPSVEPVLVGKPWDAESAPRVKINDDRPPGSPSIAPSIRVELRCRREDLEITDIQIDRASWRDRAVDAFRRNKELAAEAVIRTRLAQAGLLSGDLSNPFALITLNATVAEPTS